MQFSFLIKSLRLIRAVYPLKHKEKTSRTLILLVMVPKVGLEPTRYHYQRILSPSRLPFHHFGSTRKLIHYNAIEKKKQAFIWVFLHFF